GQLGQGDRQNVGGNGDRLAVKVSGGVGEPLLPAIRRRPVSAEAQVPWLSILREKKRIVRRGVDLPLGDAAGKGDRVAARAVHQRQPFFERRLHLFRFEAEKGRQLARFSVWHRHSCLCLREYIKLPYSEERRE